jgi:formylmethanofuran dehydrogenase subunit B
MQGKLVFKTQEEDEKKTTLHDTKKHAYLVKYWLNIIFLL